MRDLFCAVLGGCVALAGCRLELPCRRRRGVHFSAGMTFRWVVPGFCLPGPFHPLHTRTILSEKGPPLVFFAGVRCRHGTHDGGVPEGIVTFAARKFSLWLRPGPLSRRFFCGD